MHYVKIGCTVLVWLLRHAATQKAQLIHTVCQEIRNDGACWRPRSEQLDLPVTTSRRRGGNRGRTSPQNGEPQHSYCRNSKSLCLLQKWLVCITSYVHVRTDELHSSTDAPVLLLAKVKHNARGLGASDFRRGEKGFHSQLTWDASFDLAPSVTRRCAGVSALPPTACFTNKSSKWFPTVH